MQWNWTSKANATPHSNRQALTLHPVKLHRTIMFVDGIADTLISKEVGNRLSLLIFRENNALGNA